MSADVVDDLSQRFALHADIYQGKTPENASPLYAHLSAHVAQDKDILKLVIDADRSTQVSNLLFGAVHYLLLQGIAHPLSKYYASLSENPLPSEQSFPEFRAFCLEHADTITKLVTHNRVQTNEVQRCTALVPAFHLIQQRHPEQPIAMIEIGSSIGLLLLWDKYSYRFDGAGTIRGEAEVTLSCRVLGSARPPVPANMPVVTYRQGIDLHPVDLYDNDAIQWVRALIWPEHKERAHVFAQAVTLARKHPPQVLSGNAAELIQGMIEAVPTGHTVCVFHSYTLNQCTPDVRERIVAEISEAAHKRPISRISLEWFYGQEQPHLELFTHTSSGTTQELLAYCESHGRAIEWL